MAPGKNKRALSFTGPSNRKIRIVGGMWKRTPLAVADVAGLRPTSERVRETLFNWLTYLCGNDFGHMTCLDMFAGTGALGFEAASRGISRVTMIEKDRAAYSRLQFVKEKLNAGQITVIHDDAVKILEVLVREGKQFDLILLDPPFRKDLLPLVLPECIKLLTKSGLVYVESDEKLTEETLGVWLPDNAPNLQILRDGQAGQVYYHLLEMKV